MKTRQKSLNLGDLGVVAPKRSRRDMIVQSHPSPPDTVVDAYDRPAKKSKRSHTSSPPAPGLMNPPQTTAIRLKDSQTKPAIEPSPPPSPVAQGSKRNSISKVDTEGINDDIVVATIQQLETTRNRPHLVKELAATLATKLPCVEKSANPSALISSRLTSYLHRSWPAISPCPLAKDLSPVHPRRLYFYLTTMPHQPIPDIAEPQSIVNRIISPSLSSASAADEDDQYLRQRQALSPSPEVDLSSPELEEDYIDAPLTPGGSFSGQTSSLRDRTNFTHPRRAASPPLEHEERDFKQTASALYEQAKARRNSQQSQSDVNMDRSPSSSADKDSKSITMSTGADETEEIAARKNSEAVAALFGASEQLRLLSVQRIDFSSPVLHPQSGSRIDDFASWKDGQGMAEPAILSYKSAHCIALPEATLGWGDTLQSPESIELDELDNMFDAC